MAERKKGEFSSRFGFLMATVGSAVGLGNLWSYPYKMGKNGGAAFLFIYLILTVLVGIVLMLAELAIGRKSGRGVVYAYRAIDKKYTFVGIFGWLAPLLNLGWFRPDYIDDEVMRSDSHFRMKPVWKFCIKYIVPPIMVFILLGQISAFFGLGWF